MQTYAFLLQPSFNRVYARSALQLAQAELQICSQYALGGRLVPTGLAELGGLPYVTFTAEALDSQALVLLASLSGVYALYAVEGELLRPLPLAPLAHFDDDLLTIPKYAGKTNEAFTKLLLNCTLFCSDFAPRFAERLSIVDPMCGRGTTLNQALMYGYHAGGLDLDERAFAAYTAFLKTYLKEKRLKHELSVSHVRDSARQITAEVLTASVGTSKERFKAGDVQTLKVVLDDTRRAKLHFKKQSQHAVVVDLPYGVQHGSQQGSQQGPGALSRSPGELIDAAVPAWAALLAPGGCLGLAWNTHVLPRAVLKDVLIAHGLTVFDDGPFLELAHRVDQAVLRDVMIAKKP